LLLGWSRAQLYFIHSNVLRHHRCPLILRHADLG
jgi:hypothetical protein